MPLFTVKLTANSDAIRKRIEIHNFKYSFTDNLSDIARDPLKYKIMDTKIKDVLF